MNVSGIRTYEPDKFIKQGWLHLIKEIFVEIADNKWLIYQLFKRDFAATYRQSLMGISWAFIIPLLSVSVFIILNRSGILNVGLVSMPYPVFAVAGIAIWQLFAVGVVQSANAILKAGSMVVKIQFSKKSLVIAAFAQAFIPFLVQLIIAILLMAIYKIPFKANALFFPFAIIPFIILSFGLGLLFSLLNAVFRDIGNLVSTLTMFLLFITPVLFAVPQSGMLTQLNSVNILYYLVAFPRDILLFGSSNLGFGFLMSSLLSLLFCIGSLIVFHLTEVRIAERV